MVVQQQSRLRAKSLTRGLLYRTVASAPRVDREGLREQNRLSSVGGHAGDGARLEISEHFVTDTIDAMVKGYLDGGIESPSVDEPTKLLMDLVRPLRPDGDGDHGHHKDGGDHRQRKAEFTSSPGVRANGRDRPPGLRRLRSGRPDLSSGPARKSGRETMVGAWQPDSVA